MTTVPSSGGLRRRMAVTLAVVVALPVLFVYALGSIPFVTAAVVGGYAGPLVPRLDPLFVVLVVAVGLVVQFVVGPRLALRLEGAEAADEADYPRVHAATRRYAGVYGLPEPSVAVVDSAAPNAFVVGRSAESATLAVTEGLLDTVDDAELDAVVAHELAHVGNRDAPLMSVAYLLPTISYYVAVGATYALYVAGRLLPYGGGHTATRRRTGGSSDDDAGKAFLVVLVGILLTMLIAALFWAASYLVFRLFSRQREYAADAAAAEATGDPAAMASALRSIDDGLTEAPDRDLREIDGGAEALFVAPIDSSNLRESPETLLNADLFPETHPPTEQRIERLQMIERETATGATAV